MKSIQISLCVAFACTPAFSGANTHLRHRDTRFAVQKLVSQLHYVRGKLAAGANNGGAIDRNRAQLTRTILDARGALGHLIRLTSVDDPGVAALRTEYTDAVRSAAAMKFQPRAGSVDGQPLFGWSAHQVERLVDPHAEIE